MRFTDNSLRTNYLNSEVAISVPSRGVPHMQLGVEFGGCHMLYRCIIMYTKSTLRYVHACTVEPLL